MSDNIVERPIVPYNPAQSKVKQKDIYNLYAPVAGQGKIGMAGYNPAEFNVKDQIVYLSENFKSGYLSKIDVTKTLPKGIIFDVNGIKTPNVWYYNCQYSVSDETIHTVTGALLVVRSEQRDERNYTQFETLLAEERIYTRKLVVTNGQISSPTTFRALLSFDDWIDFTNELEVLDSKKLDKVTSRDEHNRAYVIANTGENQTLPLSNLNVPYALVQRDGSGNSEVSSPKQDLHIANKQYVDAADENLSNEIETLRQDIDSKSHFRGYLTTAEIQSLLNPDNGDYAWSSDTLTVWSYNGSAWVNTGNPVPDQTVPKGDSIPLPDAATGSAGSSTSYAGIDHVHPQSAIYESASAANAKWQAQGQVNETIFNTIEDVSTSLAGVIGEALSDIPLSPEQTGAAITGKDTLNNAKVSVQVGSKNLFDYNSKNINETTKFANGFRTTDYSCSEDPANNPYFKSGVSYTISYKSKTVGQGNNTELFGKVAIYNFTKGKFLYLPIESGTTFTIPDEDNGDIIGYVLYGSNIAPVSENYAEITNIQIEQGTEATEYTPYVADGTSVNVTACGGNIYNPAESYTNAGATYPATVGQSVEIVQYDKITNVFTDNAGVTVSAAFKQSTRYELDTKPVSLAGTYAERPTGIYPYVVLYTATDRSGETYRLEANTDGSVSENWVSIGSGGSGGSGGESGLPALVYNELKTYLNPSVGAMPTFTLDKFNRTPIKDEYFVCFTTPPASYEKHTYCMLIQVGTVMAERNIVGGTIISFVETTGAQGQEGVDGTSIYTAYKAFTSETFTLDCISGYENIINTKGKLLEGDTIINTDGVVFEVTATTEVTSPISKAPVSSDLGVNLKGPQGEKGETGTEALICGGFSRYDSPAYGKAVDIDIGLMNRTPVKGERFVAQWINSSTNQTYLVSFRVNSVYNPDNTANCMVSTFSETTGPQGEAAGFGTPTASATKLAASAQPTVSVTSSGADTAKVFNFAFGIPSGDVLPTKLYNGAPFYIGVDSSRVLVESGIDLGVSIVGKMLLVEIGTSNSASADNIYVYQQFFVKFIPANSAGTNNISICVFSLNDWSNYVAINLGMDGDAPTKLTGGAFRQTQAQAGQEDSPATPLNKFITAVWDVTEIFN